MNIINIEDEKVKTKLKKREVLIEYELGKNVFDISKIKIDILKDTTLNLNINLSDIKADIKFNIAEDVNCTINMFVGILKGKIKYTYNVLKNSQLLINKFNDSKNIKEFVITNLNGENSIFDYNFKSISKDKEVYDILVNHNSKLTTSDIKNNIINLSGNVLIQVSTVIEKGNINTLANQNNKIINLTNKKCEIKPNLFIDEYDSSANHSAYIGKFSKEELFYLMSRGLTQKQATDLLIKGILTSEINDESLIIKINDILKKYWR